MSEAVFKRVAEVWGLKQTETSPGVHLMWKGKKLHSIAYIAEADDTHLLVPISKWVNMRAVGDRMSVATSVYFESGDRVGYVSWSVHSGLGYGTSPGGEDGGAVRVPKSELKPVKVAEKKK